jgi:hypothetical protein
MMTKIKKPDHVPQTAFDYLIEQYQTYFDDVDGKRHYRHDIETIENIITSKDAVPLWCEIKRLEIDGGAFMYNFDFAQNYGDSSTLEYIKQTGIDAIDVIKQTRQLIKTLKLANYDNYFIHGLNELLKNAMADKRRYDNQRRYVNRTREKAYTTFFCNKLAEFFKHKTGDTQDKLIVICASIAFKDDYFDSSRVTKSVRKTKSRL